MKATRFGIPTMFIAVIALLGAVSAGLVSVQDAAGSEPQSSSGCANGIAVPDPDNNPGLVSDCEALLASRDALAGTATLNWSADIDMVAWDGVVLGGTPQRVTGLGLSDRQLDGSIPAELGNLSALEELYLLHNRLTGTIPTELGSLSNLRHLDLYTNQLTGPIPDALGNLNNLELLRLEKNLLVGSIPAELGSLSRLVKLVLSRNELTGEMPSELGSLASLGGLELSYNQLTGPIPVELANLSNLEVLYLSENELTGCVPDGLRDVEENDFLTLGLPFCDVVLSGLSTGPRTLTPLFDPYHNVYTTTSGLSRITVTAVADGDETVRFLDDKGDAIPDADEARGGHQVDIESGVTTIKVEVTSADGTAVNIYIITVASGACVSGVAVPDPARNLGLVSDCEALLASRDALAGTATLNWSADIDMAAWDGVRLDGTPGV